MNNDDLRDHEPSIKIDAMIELCFVVPARLADSLLDQRTGEIDPTLLADAVTVRIGDSLESHYLRVTEATWRY